MDSKYFSQSSSVKSTVKDKKAEVSFILSTFGGGASFLSLTHPICQNWIGKNWSAEHLATTDG